MVNPFAFAPPRPIHLKPYLHPERRILRQLSLGEFALPFADQTTVALPIMGGPQKLFIPVPAIIARTGSASTLGTFFRRRIWHAE
jgi:hypothetical protein